MWTVLRWLAETMQEMSLYHSNYKFVCPLTVTALRAWDFVIDRLLKKLCKTTDKNIVKNVNKALRRSVY